MSLLTLEVIFLCPRKWRWASCTWLMCVLYQAWKPASQGPAVSCRVSVFLGSGQLLCPCPPWSFPWVPSNRMEWAHKCQMTQKEAVSWVQSGKLPSILAFTRQPHAPCSGLSNKQEENLLTFPAWSRVSAFSRLHCLYLGFSFTEGNTCRSRSRSLKVLTVFPPKTNTSRRWYVAMTQK